MIFTKSEKAIIYEAFDLYYANYCKTLPTNEELSYIKIPDALDAKIKKLIEREKKFYFYWFNTVGKRVAAIILAILISLTTVTFSVKALREPFIRFIVETYEKFSNVIFVNDRSESDILETDDFILEVIEPKYIPEQYALEYNFEDDVVYQARYFNSDRSSMIFYMQAMNDEGILQANTESVEYEDILINDYSAIYYFNKGTNTIILSGERYIFTIEGTIDKEELFKIAESIDIK